MAVTIERRKRKSGTAVLLSYRDAHGKRIRKSIGMADGKDALRAVLDSADRERKRIDHELAEGKHRPKVGEVALAKALTEFAEHLAASTVKPSTVRAYRETLKKWSAFSDRHSMSRVRDVTPARIKAYVLELSNAGKAPDTIGGDLIRLQHVWGYFIRQEWAVLNPFKHQDVREVWPARRPHERAFTAEEWTAFKVVLGQSVHSPYAQDYADILTILAETGLRVGEALHLRAVDVSLGNSEGAFLRVEPWGDWSPKTKKSIRSVPLTPEGENIVRRRIKALAAVDLSATLFPKGWTNRSVNQYFNRILRRAKLEGRNGRGEKLRVHSLRHAYATNLVTAKVDPATIRDILGHGSLITTNRYLNVPRSELFAAVGALSRTQRVHKSSGVERFPAENQG